MKKILISLVAAFMTLNANAAIERHSLDAKFPTQQMVEAQYWAAVAPANTILLLNNVATAGSSVVQTISTFSAQPAEARNLVLTPSNSSASVGTCTVTVSGTNYYNAAITETMALTAGSLTAITGNKAFKTVTSVAFPAACVTGIFNAKWSLGVGTKLGLKNCLDDAGHWVSGIYNGVYESTRATVVASTSNVESNTAVFNSALNNYNLYGFFMQNFRCTN